MKKEINSDWIVVGLIILVLLFSGVIFRIIS